MHLATRTQKLFILHFICDGSFCICIPTYSASSPAKVLPDMTSQTVQINVVIPSEFHAFRPVNLNVSLSFDFSFESRPFFFFFFFFFFFVNNNTPRRRHLIPRFGHLVALRLPTVILAAACLFRKNTLSRVECSRQVSVELVAQLDDATPEWALCTKCTTRGKKQQMRGTQ